MLDLIIKNGTVVNADGSARADVAVKDGAVAAVGDARCFAQAERTVDASGMLVLPGMIDTHVHIANKTGRFPSEASYADGTLAAAYGGTTAVADFAFMFPGETPLTAMERKLAEAGGQCYTDYTFHPYVNGRTAGSAGELRELIRAGFRSVKMFTVYRETHMLPKNTLRSVLEMVAQENGIALIHAECAEMIEENIARFIAEGRTTPQYHALSRPPISEIEAMYGVLAMARDTGAPVIYAHMTTSLSRALLSQAKPDTHVYSEVCPHYLVLSDERYAREDGYKYVCSPPIRPKADQEALWGMLADGLVDIVSSDHTDYTAAMKERGRNFFPDIPNGLPTIEHRGTVLFSEGVVRGRFSAERFVELTSAKAAKLMGLWPKKGLIAPGADADLVVFDPAARWTISASNLHMKTDYTPYEGLEVTGRVRDVFVRGGAVILNGEHTGAGPAGRLMPQSAPVLN